jgi:membrane-bound lytic murein transglycosylase D
MLVKAGSTLLVHRKGALDNDVHETVADRAQLSLLPELVLRSLQVAARKGDTMASLAARHGVSAASLASWNKLRVDQPLKAGQRLMVLVPAKPNPSEATRATRKPSKAPTGKSKRSPRKKA